MQHILQCITLYFTVDNKYHISGNISNYFYISNFWLIMIYYMATILFLFPKKFNSNNYSQRG